MKNYIQLFSMILMCLLIAQDGISQRKKKRPSKEIDIKKLTLIELQKGNNKYPSSYLRNVKGDSLMLYTTIKHQDKSVSYVKKSVLLDDFEYIKITNKKERIKKSLMWGLGIGTVTYFVTQKLAKNPGVAVGQGGSVFPKAGSKGIIEGLNAGLFGFGVGIIIQNQILHRRMSIADEKRAILKKLK